MKNSALVFALVATAAFCAPAHAVFKCTTAKGVVYQDRPCREGNEADLNLVIPTGERVLNATPASAGEAQAGRPEVDSRSADAATRRTPSDTSVSARQSRDASTSNAVAAGEATRRTSSDTSVSARQSRDARTSNAVAAGDATRGKDSRQSAQGAAAPMTGDQARATEPSAKYFATEAFGSGNETPIQMNCESPTGERRTFYLSNGKLTSI
jgi:hypothetical protein